MLDNNGLNVLITGVNCFVGEPLAGFMHDAGFEVRGVVGLHQENWCMGLIWNNIIVGDIDGLNDWAERGA